MLYHDLKSYQLSGIFRNDAGVIINRKAIVIMYISVNFHVVCHWKGKSGQCLFITYFFILSKLNDKIFCIDYVLQTPTRHPAKRQFSESTPRNKGKKEGPVNEIMGVAKDIVKSLHARTQTSEDAFGSYVALRLKEMDRVTSSKRKQEIIAILDASASNSE